MEVTIEELEKTIKALKATIEEQQASHQELIASNKALQSTNEELRSGNEILEEKLAERTRVLTHFSQSLQELHRLDIRNYDYLQDLFIDCLNLGRKVLDFQHSILSQVEGRTYTIRAVQSELAELSVGKSMDYEETYCKQVIERQQTIAYKHVGNMPGMRNNPTYQRCGFESYLATPVLVHGKLYGTLSFSSNRPRETDFKQYDLEMLELIANILGAAIEADRAQTQIQENQERYQLVVQGSGAGIWDENFQTGEGIMSDRCYQILGETADSTFIANLADFFERIHPDDQDTVEQALNNHLNHREVYCQEFRMLHKDGSYVWIKDQGQAVWDEQGNPMRMAGSIEDISDRKQAEVDILKSLERERELKEMKSRFISNTSHEFRTPLAVIANNAEILKLFSNKLDETEKLECLDVILDYVEHATSLLDEVLIVNKAEAGKISLTILPLEVIPFSQKLCQDIAKSLPDHDYQFVLEDERSEDLQSETYALLDSKLLRQILTNLLTNAGKYSPTDSHVTFEVKLYDELVKFHIIDQGFGISEVDQEHLFEPFHRGSNVGSVAGTGLGLSIVKHLVTIHQGAIAVSSELDKGSCFTVTIPTQWQQEVS